MKLILGTMTFGEQIFGADAKVMIETFLDRGYREIDTAYVYNEGECEKILGNSIDEYMYKKIKLATKVNPRITGKLDADAVYYQVEGSLKRLKKTYVDTLYLHFPDANTPIESALSACNDLYEQGKIRELGLSNFPAWLVADVYYRCKNNGWLLPAVYEGLYNPLSRFAERELNDALDEYNMRFYAYNPLAGGLLTNKYNEETKDVIEGRFTFRPNYKKRYWKPSFFEAVKMIKKSCAEQNISISEAAYRWLVWNSMLNVNRGDGIIIGASRISQLEQNIDAAGKGKLDEKIAASFDEAWEMCKKDAPEYFRYYNKK